MVVVLKSLVSYIIIIDTKYGRISRVVHINKETLIESIKQIESIVHKIHAIDQSKLNKSQQTLTQRRLEALAISLFLMKEKLLTYA